MYSIAKSTLDLFYRQYRQIVEITMNRTDSTEYLTEANIIRGGMTVDRYCISGDKIEIGSAIAAELTLKLDNREGKFDDTNFEGAELFVRIGIKKWDAGRWENAKVEYVPIGYFTVDESPKKALSITLSALDRMVQFDKDFDADGITFPTTVGNLLTYCCTKCGVPLKTIPETLPNHSYQVKECPQRENLTYRQIIQWIGEITATCGYIDWDGKLRMEWYSDTDTVIDKSLRYSSDMNEKDVTITGVRVEDDEENIYLAGTDEYALNIEGNALIQYDHNVIAHAVFERVNGFTYRPYTCTTKSLPHLYPMDKISYVDKNGVSHNSIVTHWVYKLNGRTHLTAKGVTATKENYAKANPLTAREATVLAKMKKANEIELNSRQQAVLALNETIVNSLGLFMSTVEEENGSIVYYYHNAATLEDSSVIYTFREGGFAWTDDWNDGTPVWKYGITKDGNALYKILSAYKIQADLIESNSITAKQIKAGAIGGFTIDDKHIGIGMTSYNDSEHDGVYLGLDGIGLGKGKFYVRTDGFLFAKFGEVGNLKIIDKLYFGNESQYYIDANNDDSSYYIKLPDFQVNKAYGAVFSGELKSAKGTFEGELSAGSVLGGNIKIKGDKIWFEIMDNGESFRICDSEKNNYFYVGQNFISIFSKYYSDGSYKSDALSSGTTVYNNYGYGTVFTSFAGCLSGTWYSENSIAIVSDENNKNSISDISEKYDVFFDNLNAKTYKYNYGTSGRLHTGFTAQGVKSALDAAEIESMDFAGYVCKNNPDGTSSQYLRYEEFISINTWQIQKLKARIARLETTVSELKEV